MDFAQLLGQSAAAAWLFIPTAILLGALHGLEPGHSKTMMVAFIVAVRGTIAQAVLLGVAATFSHTMVVWAVAMTGMYFFQGLDGEVAEPYFQLASAVLIIAIAIWMCAQTWKNQRAAKRHRREVDADEAGRDKQSLSRRIDTGHGFMALELSPEQPAHWRLRVISGDRWTAEHVTLTVERADGSSQQYDLVDCDGYMESVEAVQGPYDFMVRVSLDHGDHEHGYDLSFTQSERSDGAARQGQGLALATEGYQDAHELSHANDIRRRFSNAPTVTNGQILLFGLTGGLIPCPAAITVLLLCIQVKQFSLGAVLVLCFSIGLAITLVAIGIVASMGMRQASKRYSWLSTAAARAPYFSSVLIVMVGIYTGYHGWSGLQHGPGAQAPTASQAHARS